MGAVFGKRWYRERGRAARVRASGVGVRVESEASVRAASAIQETLRSASLDRQTPSPAPSLASLPSLPSLPTSIPVSLSRSIPAVPADVADAARKTALAEAGLALLATPAAYPPALPDLPDPAFLTRRPSDQLTQPVSRSLSSNSAIPTFAKSVAKSLTSRELKSDDTQ